MKKSFSVIKQKKKSKLRNRKSFTTSQILRPRLSTPLAICRPRFVPGSMMQAHLRMQKGWRAGSPSPLPRGTQTAAPAQGAAGGPRAPLRGPPWHWGALGPGQHRCRSHFREIDPFPTAHQQRWRRTNERRIFLYLRECMKNIHNSDLPRPRKHSKSEHNVSTSTLTKPPSKHAPWRWPVSTQWLGAVF